MNTFVEGAIVGGVVGLLSGSTLAGVICALVYIILESL